jgi:predicted nuclease of predicted toxin-antitoxin system
MRFLANENFPLDVVEALRQAGHDVGWVRTDAPGSSDQEVLARAQMELRVLLTFDKDFGDLAFRASLPADCGIVLFRLVAASSSVLATKVVAALHARSDWSGHFSVVEAGRIRMRSLVGSPPPSAGNPP